MTLAFDPKWSQVVAMSYLEGINGATAVASERGSSFTLNNCSVSSGVSRWGRGSVFFPSDSTEHSISGGAIAVRATDQQAIQGSFYSTDVSGNRFILGIGNRISLLVQNATLYLVMRTSGASDPSYVVAAASPVQAERWYDYTIRTNSAGFSLELDGSVVASGTYGGETDGGVFTGFRLGNQGVTSAAASWRGYLGPFRWTQGDRRLEDSGKPAYRFPVLGAVDPEREKVVFHSHCEPTVNGVISDTRGAPVQMLGADIAATAKFGIGSLRSQAPLACAKIGPLPGLIPGARDFVFETHLQISLRDNFKYFFALFDGSATTEAAMVLGLGIGGESTLYLRLNGTTSSHVVASAFNAWRHVKLIRVGDVLSLYYNSVLVTTRNVAGLSIVSDGYAWLGGAGGVGGYGNPHLLIDEPRFTVGSGRFNPTLTTVPEQVEVFSDFGPRSLSGIIDDADGNPVVCKVRAYHSATGRLVSESTTDSSGAFVLPVGDLDEHFWTAHMPGKEALIGDHVLPVVIT